MYLGYVVAMLNIKLNLHSLCARISKCYVNSINSSTYINKENLEYLYI